MRMFEQQTFKQVFDQDSGAVFEKLTFSKCVFDNCALSLTKTPKLRSTVRNVQLMNCTSFNCGVGPAVFEDVTVDGLETNDLLIAWGSLFKHVTLRGNIDKIKINRTANFWDPRSEMQQPFEVARSRFYETVDWALDITAACFKEFDMGGVPARLVRRDPTTQVVVTREKALRSGWREQLSGTNTYWPMVIDLFLQDGEQDIVLVAPKRKPKTKLSALIRGLNELRRIGIAEPD